MTDLQRRIKRHWYPPKICTSSPKAVVHFSIEGDGTLKKLRMYKGSGIQIFDSAALKAVENAAPFKPLPADTPSTVDIEFTQLARKASSFRSRMDSASRLRRLGDHRGVFCCCMY